MRILLVEGDAVVAEQIQAALQKEKFSVELAADGESALEIARDGGPFALILMDVTLPGRDGLSVCEALRARRDPVPILMLTTPDRVEDRVRGLESGADDILPKPFDMKELLARVRALLRRDRIHKSRVIRIADLEIETLARRVRRAGREVSLTPHEYALLEALATYEGRTLTREIILDRVWGSDDTYSNTVDVHIAALRKKIDAGQAAKLIHTVHGVGYVLRAPEARAKP
jgi:DNA-binding response OmpR family regulator